MRSYQMHGRTMHCRISAFTMRVVVRVVKKDSSKQVKKFLMERHMYLGTEREACSLNIRGILR